MTKNAAAWRERWRVLVVCRQCDAAFECENPSASLERVGGFNRMFIAGGPEVCPKCKNLKVMEGSHSAEVQNAFEAS